jgi:hypothetical protein
MQHILRGVRSEERLQRLTLVGLANVEQDRLDVCSLSGNSGSAKECFAVTVKEANEGVIGDHRRPLGFQSESSQERISGLERQVAVDGSLAVTSHVASAFRFIARSISM